MKDLAAVSLNKPVRVFVNENTDVALSLRQEFVRIRANREGDREAIVAGRRLGEGTVEHYIPNIKDSGKLNIQDVHVCLQAYITGH